MLLKRIYDSHMTTYTLVIKKISPLYIDNMLNVYRLIYNTCQNLPEEGASIIVTLRSWGQTTHAWPTDDLYDWSMCRLKYGVNTLYDNVETD